VASFIAPIQLGHFVGLELDLDIALPASDPHSADALPDWWRLGVSECRAGNLKTPKTFPGIGTGLTGACQSPWQTAPLTGAGFLYTSNYLGNPNRAHLRTVLARSNETTLIAGQQYVAQLMTLDTVGDVLNANGMCPGCCQSMMVTLSKIELDSTAGSPEGDVIFLTNPATRNFVWWNQVACDSPTPTHRSSWGAIKSTYR